MSDSELSFKQLQLQLLAIGSDDTRIVPFIHNLIGRIVVLEQQVNTLEQKVTKMDNKEMTK